MKLLNTFMNISLDSLKEIVKKADEELGGTNGSVCINFERGKESWSTREQFYKPTLSYHPLILIEGDYYSNNKTYSELRIIKKGQKR
jgi:hypothetical protein